MKTKRYTIREFQEQFPDDDTCLEYLKNLRWPDGIYCEKCQKVTKHHRITTRKVYSCQHCGTQVSPTAGTIFHKSATSLRDWFYAMYLMTSTRCGISAKQLERELGVTYKTAWRMAKEIRQTLMSPTDEPLGVKSGVEVDETFVGGKVKNMHKAKRAQFHGRGTAGKTPVWGAVEREGKVVAVTVPNVDGITLLPQVKRYVIPAATVYTDEMGAYKYLRQHGYNHRKINHMEQVYVSGDVHTNTIEGFWSLVKRGIGGVYHSVSVKHLQGYLNEYSWRYNHRDDGLVMFDTLLLRAARM